MGALDMLHNWLQEESQTKRACALEDDWQWKHVAVTQQENGDDCGVHMRVAVEDVMLHGHALLHECVPTWRVRSHIAKTIYDEVRVTDINACTASQPNAVSSFDAQRGAPHSISIIRCLQAHGIIHLENTILYFLKPPRGHLAHQLHTVRKQVKFKPMA